MSRSFGIAVDGYALASLNDAASRRSLQSFGGGIALVWGLGPQGQRWRR